MVVLLLIFDKGRSHRLAQSVRAFAPEAHCIESCGGAGTWRDVAPERVDLVVLDPALLRRADAADLVDWWLSTPGGELLVLKTDPDTDLKVCSATLTRVLRRTRHA